MSRAAPTPGELRAAAHAPLDTQREVFERAVRANGTLARALEALEPDEWVGAGAVFQGVWNLMSGEACDAHIKDLDVLYFDASDLSAQAEAARARREAPGGLELDVVNVARVHLWYEEVFGSAIPQYESVAHSVATWPTQCSAFAVRRGEEGGIEVIAPFGFHDLFAGWIRPNKVQISREVYEAKVARWTATWPWLLAWGWDEGERPERQS